MSNGASPEDVLAASLAATWEYVRSEGHASVEELARAAGISRRTFHRYFPSKADCIRPAIADATRMFAAILEAEPADLPLTEAWLNAYRTIAGGAFTERTRLLLPLLESDQALAAAFAHEWTTATTHVQSAIAHRLRDPQGAETVATVLLTVMRLSWHDAVLTGDDPVTPLRNRLAELESLFVLAGEDPSKSRADVPPHTP